MLRVLGSKQTGDGRWSTPGKNRQAVRQNGGMQKTKTSVTCCCHGDTLLFTIIGIKYIKNKWLCIKTETYCWIPCKRLFILFFKDGWWKENCSLCIHGQLAAMDPGPEWSPALIFSSIHLPTKMTSGLLPTVCLIPCESSTKNLEKLPCFQTFLFIILVSWYLKMRRPNNHLSKYT